ncbi:MAG: P1 family peptidase [Anaerolineales bacterium]|nr:P1 family peptidase [Anaerolineales bacterium]
MINTAGLKIGHATDTEFNTGCTVFLCPDGTVGGVDIRGMAPGSRETALLDPIKSVPNVNAILFTGGSAFGLATADGAMRWHAERDIGHFTPIRRIPIIPAAVVFDLFINGGQKPPTAEFGYAACEAATDNIKDIAQGNVGAGAGVTVGKWTGPQSMMKGGFGMASVEADGAAVFAAAVVNAVGDVVNEDGTVLAGAYKQEGGWKVADDPLRRFPERPTANITNTTLVVVATTAALNKVEANRLAQRAHDGFAIAIRPVHTMHDGDTAFALSTGKVTDVPFDVIGNAAVTVVAEAIRNAVRYAQTTKGILGLAK